MEKLLTKQNDRRFHLRTPATSKADRDFMTSQRIRRMRSKLRSSRAHTIKINTITRKLKIYQKLYNNRFFDLN